MPSNVAGCEHTWRDYLEFWQKNCRIKAISMKTAPRECISVHRRSSIRFNVRSVKEAMAVTQPYAMQRHLVFSKSLRERFLLTTCRSLFRIDFGPKFEKLIFSARQKNTGSIMSHPVSNGEKSIFSRGEQTDRKHSHDVTDAHSNSYEKSTSTATHSHHRLG